MAIYCQKAAAKLMQSGNNGPCSGLLKSIEVFVIAFSGNGIVAVVIKDHVWIGPWPRSKEIWGPGWEKLPGFWCLLSLDFAASSSDEALFCTVPSTMWLLGANPKNICPEIMWWAFQGSSPFFLLTVVEEWRGDSWFKMGRLVAPGSEQCVKEEEGHIKDI